MTEGGAGMTEGGAGMMVNGERAADSRCSAASLGVELGRGRRQDLDRLSFLRGAGRSLEIPATLEKILKDVQDRAARQHDLEVHARDFLPPPLVVDAPAIDDFFDGNSWGA